MMEILTVMTVVAQLALLRLVTLVQQALRLLLQSVQILVVIIKFTKRQAAIATMLLLLPMEMDAAHRVQLKQDTLAHLDLQLVLRFAQIYVVIIKFTK